MGATPSLVLLPSSDELVAGVLVRVRSHIPVAFPLSGKGIEKMAAEASGSGDPDDLATMMKELGLSEEDLDDVVIDQQSVPPEATRWMAVARVNTEKQYSQYWFYRNMRAAWNLAQKVNIRPLEDNLYTLQFACLGDWERVMGDGPWAF